MRTYILISILLLFSCNALQAQDELRDPLHWPFSKTSIWNMPIGSGANFINANIQCTTGGYAMTNYHDIIIMTPDEPLMDVYTFPGGWSSDRCLKGEFLGQLPIPNDFYLPYTEGQSTYDHPLAVLEQNHRIINQSQPAQRCPENIFYTTEFWNYPNVDIYGQGIEGAHGGSGLSSIGGCIRLGEFSKGKIPHAVKISMYAKKYYYYDKKNDPTPGYRWTAVKADGYADGEYAVTNPSFEQGSLLALKPDFDINLCKTVPGKILAQTFKDYGAYIVDDSKWDVFKIPIENGPQGSVDDEFKNLYGYDYRQTDKNHPWGKDVITIFQNLYIVDNNSPTSIGGGGEPIAPMAPDLIPYFNLTVRTDNTEGAKINNPGTYITTKGKTNTLRVLEVPNGYVFEKWEIVGGEASLTNANQLIAKLVLENGNVTVQANFIKDENHQGLRNPYLWPFKKTSIWNMPIGSDAEYVPAPLARDFISCFFWNKRQNNCSFIQLVFSYTGKLFRLGINQTRNMKSTFPGLYLVQLPLLHRGVSYSATMAIGVMLRYFIPQVKSSVNMAFPGNVENMVAIVKNIRSQVTG